MLASAFHRGYRACDHKAVQIATWRRGALVGAWVRAVRQTNHDRPPRICPPTLAPTRENGQDDCRTEKRTDRLWRTSAPDDPQIKLAARRVTPTIYDQSGLVAGDEEETQGWGINPGRVDVRGALGRGIPVQTAVKRTMVQLQMALSRLTSPGAFSVIDKFFKLIGWVALIGAVYGIQKFTQSNSPPISFRPKWLTARPVV